MVLVLSMSQNQVIYVGACFNCLNSLIVFENIKLASSDGQQLINIIIIIYLNTFKINMIIHKSQGKLYSQEAFENELCN